jgi:hypothetical protein
MEFDGTVGGIIAASAATGAAAIAQVRNKFVQRKERKRRYAQSDVANAAEDAQPDAQPV